MKRFFNTLCFVSLSILALGQSTQGDSYSYVSGDVNIIKENTPEKPKVDTIITYYKDTSVVYETSTILPPPTMMLVRHAAYERRMFGVKKYSYGDTQMDEKALAKFFRDNNRDVYIKYMKNRNLKTAGWSLFGGGLAMIFIGGMCHLDEDFHYSGGQYFYEPSDEGMIAGFTIWPIGLVSVITSIPILCVGYANDDKIVKQFNSARSGTAITLGLTSSQNGIGLALNF